MSHVDVDLRSRLSSVVVLALPISLANLRMNSVTWHLSVGDSPRAPDMVRGIRHVAVGVVGSLQLSRSHQEADCESEALGSLRNQTQKPRPSLPKLVEGASSVLVLGSTPQFYSNVKLCAPQNCQHLVGAMELLTPRRPLRTSSGA